ncbi:MAG TPA: UDP-N-acetylmuramoyl-L-alanyl-D-glutamate--2,6-diaminopimelate ligase [Candidatus Cottocaccamicrobium excrementipullorum]|nr:UDP-N-acetylmuramoyl-L-alanyl-D-glutamate--2,6-diaminopimelate ligase [Candidatus Cottocaccamicrobium excrementipullorum]
MKIKDWLKKVSCTLLQGSLETEVNEVVYDSRKAAPGCVFVCMKGANVDSHQFCQAVYQAGCRVFVVEHPVELPQDCVVIQTENGRKALALLSAARFGYPAEKITVIGVTGTKGKTTTTHMIKGMLEACGQKTGMIGTNGIDDGQSFYPSANTTPESYDLHRYFAAMVENGCRYVVMEVSSQAFKLNRTWGIQFDYGVFTNLSPDHIGPNEHKDFQEYLHCKSMIFNQSKIGIANRDDEHFEQITQNADCPVYTYTMEQDGDFVGEHLRYVSQDGFVGLEFQVKGRISAEVKVGIPGRFNAMNALAAISTVSFLGLPMEQMLKGLEHIHVNGRMEIAWASEKFQVIIDYAHNAVSMESLLQTLRAYHPKRLVVVFGCGGNRSKDRRYSMGEIAGKMADLSILTADNSRYEKVEDIIEDIKQALIPTKGAYLEIPDRREAISYAIEHAQPGDMIAIIGKGHEDYQEVNGVRTHFLDREVVDQVIQSLYAGEKPSKE